MDGVGLAAAAVRRTFLPLVLNNSVTICKLPAPQMLEPEDGANVNSLIPTFTSGARRAMG